MEASARTLAWPICTSVIAAFALACSSVQEPSKAPQAKTSQAPAAGKKEQPSKGETKAAKKKAVEVEGVISSVGQRTITFQMERKGKVRQEVVGVDEKTNIEKGGNKVKLRDLQETDKALINYEPGAYTPAIAIKVTGKGAIKKGGGDD
ncbi:MAG: hypothetical protein ACREQ7_24395 [Candidatus Binatia bacterium]